MNQPENQPTDFQLDLETQLHDEFQERLSGVRKEVSPRFATSVMRRIEDERIQSRQVTGRQRPAVSRLKATLRWLAISAVLLLMTCGALLVVNWQPADTVVDRTRTVPPYRVETTAEPGQGMRLVTGGLAGALRIPRSPNDAIANWLNPVLPAKNADDLVVEQPPAPADESRLVAGLASQILGNRLN